MAADIRRVWSPTLVFGLGIVMVGVILTLQTTHLVPAETLARLWPLALVALGVAVIVQGVVGRDDGRRFSWVPIVVVLIVGSVATQAAGRSLNVKRTESADDVRVSAVMGGSQTISQAAAFRHAELSAMMGGAQLDLRQATIAPGTVAAIDVDVFMGGVVLRVPDQWVVETETTALMAGVEDRRPSGSRKPSDADPTAPHLKVRGTVVMGGIEIRK